MWRGGLLRIVLAAGVGTAAGFALSPQTLTLGPAGPRARARLGARVPTAVRPCSDPMPPPACCAATLARVRLELPAAHVALTRALPRRQAGTRCSLGRELQHQTSATLQAATPLAVCVCV